MWEIVRMYVAMGLGALGLGLLLLTGKTAYGVYSRTSRLRPDGLPGGVRSGSSDEGLHGESTSGEAIPPSPYDAAEATAYTTGKTWSVRPQRASGSRSGERFSRSDATRPGEGGDAWAPALNLEGGVRRTTGVDPEDSNEGKEDCSDGSTTGSSSMCGTAVAPDSSVLAIFSATGWKPPLQRALEDDAVVRATFCGTLASVACSSDEADDDTCALSSTVQDVAGSVEDGTGSGVSVGTRSNVSTSASTSVTSVAVGGGTPRVPLTATASPATPFDGREHASWELPMGGTGAGNARASSRRSSPDDVGGALAVFSRASRTAAGADQRAWWRLRLSRAIETGRNARGEREGGRDGSGRRVWGGDGETTRVGGGNDGNGNVNGNGVGNGVGDDVEDEKLAPEDEFPPLRPSSIFPARGIEALTRPRGRRRAKRFRVAAVTCECGDPPDLHGLPAGRGIPARGDSVNDGFRWRKGQMGADGSRVRDDPLSSCSRNVYRRSFLRGSSVHSCPETATAGGVITSLGDSEGRLAVAAHMEEEKAEVEASEMKVDEPRGSAVRCEHGDQHVLEMELGEGRIGAEDVEPLADITAQEGMLPKARALFRGLSEVDHDLVSEKHRLAMLSHLARTSMTPATLNPPLRHVLGEEGNGGGQ